MKRCKHDKLEFLGKERGDGSVNVYYMCKRCGGVVVFTKEGKAYLVAKEK